MRHPLIPKTADNKTGIPSIISDDNGMPVFHFLPGISHRTGGVYIHSEKMQEVSKGGCAAFGSGFPIGTSSTLLAHDFACKV